MSQPKNSTTPVEVQQIGITELSFCGCPNGDYLLQTRAGTSVIEALDIAADLADGIQQISTRFAAELDEGELIYVAEMRSLAMLAEVASAFTRAAERGMRRTVGGDQ